MTVQGVRLTKAMPLAVAATPLISSPDSADGTLHADAFRNNTLLTAVTTTSSTVTGLTPATAHQFFVQSRDAAGHATAGSRNASIYTRS